SAATVQPTAIATATTCGRRPVVIALCCNAPEVRPVGRTTRPTTLGHNAAVKWLIHGPSERRLAARRRRRLTQALQLYGFNEGDGLPTEAGGKELYAPRRGMTLDEPISKD